LHDLYDYDFQDEDDTPPLKEIKYELPPYNGFGDPLDSEQNCKNLITKPPKKNFFKFLDTDVEYTFKARSKETNGDVLEYIIKYFENDETLNIFRIDTRNNG